MSVESSRAFLRVAYDSPELKQRLKAVTGTQEIVRLGQRYGYSFDVAELMEASSSFTGAPEHAPEAGRSPARGQEAGASGRRKTARPRPAAAGRRSAVLPGSALPGSAEAGRRKAGRPASATGGAPETEPPGAAASRRPRARRTTEAAGAAGVTDPAGAAGSATRPPGGPLHHEYRLDDLPGLKGVIEQLPRLKIKPPSVDLARFAAGFREEDLRSTSMSPANPEFQLWHQAMMKAHWRDPGLGSGAPRRDFHLVNLDEHIAHDGYDRYLAAKHRVVRTLEEFFDAEVRFSGSLWYPPSSYRLWHTNETQPGWRMYVIDFDESPADQAETSFFRYMDPRTKEIVTLGERPRMVRFFKAEHDPGRLFWHCIVNPTSRHRWSFGFVVPDDWMTAIARQA
jgi:hypothetical protein